MVIIDKYLVCSWGLCWSSKVVIDASDLVATQQDRKHVWYVTTDMLSFYYFIVIKNSRFQKYILKYSSISYGIFIGILIF